MSEKTILEKKKKGDDSQLVHILKKSKNKEIFLYKNSLEEYFVRIVTDGEPVIYKELCENSDDTLPEIYHVECDGSRTIVEEEYIDGMTLTEVLEQGTLSEGQALHIMKKLCQALKFLHGRDIVHRDIKTDNIILTKENRVVLLDFDSARKYKLYETGDTETLGTPGYAAPEQYGIRQTDFKADIYAMGILLNIMLTGEHPAVCMWQGKWKHVIEVCTRINPEKRYKDVVRLECALKDEYSHRSWIVRGIVLACVMIAASAAVVMTAERLQSENGAKNSINENRISKNTISESAVDTASMPGEWGDIKSAELEKEDEIADGNEHINVVIFRADEKYVLFQMSRAEYSAYDVAYDCVAIRQSSGIYTFSFTSYYGNYQYKGSLKLENKEKLYIDVAWVENGSERTEEVCPLEYSGYLPRIASDSDETGEDVIMLDELLGVPWEVAKKKLGTPFSDEQSRTNRSYYFDNLEVVVGKSSNEVWEISVDFERGGSWDRMKFRWENFDFTMLKDEFTEELGTPYREQQINFYGFSEASYKITKNQKEYWLILNYDLSGVIKSVTCSIS